MVQEKTTNTSQGGTGFHLSLEIVTVVTCVSWVVDRLVGLDKDVTRQKGHFTDVLNLSEVSKTGEQLDIVGVPLFCPQVFPRDLTRCSEQMIVKMTLPATFVLSSCVV